MSYKEKPNHVAVEMVCFDFATSNTTGDGKFYYHAWPEVLLRDWVAVDPTFGQFPADHLEPGTVELSRKSLIRLTIGLQVCNILVLARARSVEQQQASGSRKC